MSCLFSNRGTADAFRDNGLWAGHPFSLRPSSWKSLARTGNSTANPCWRLCRRKRKAIWTKWPFLPIPCGNISPKAIPPKRMEETIIKLLEQWQRKGAAAILEHYLPVFTILRFIVIHIMNWAHAALPLLKCRRNLKKNHFQHSGRWRRNVREGWKLLRMI